MLSATETATSVVSANQAARQHGVPPVETSSSSCIQDSHEVSVVAKLLTPILTLSRPVKRSSGARVLTSEE